MPPKIEELLMRWDQRIADFFDGGPLRRGFYSLWVGIQRHAGAKTASAMAFNLFLAGIPTLAFTGWLAAHLLGRSPEALGLISVTMNLTPIELTELVEKNFQRFGASAVAPVALLGAFWLVSSAFHMLMEVFEVALHTKRRPWWKKRLIAIGCALAANVMFAVTIWISVKIAGGPAAILHAVRAGERLAGPAERAVTIIIALTGLTCAIAGFFWIAVHRPGLTRRVWPGALVTVTIGAFIVWRCESRGG